MAAAAAIAVPGSSATAADVGDGLLACSRGEICFKKHADSNWQSLLKHFWYNDRNHDNNYWSGTTTDVVGEIASMYWNRDTECEVFVHDYQPWPLPNFTLELAQGGTSWYVAFSGSWNDENDGHSRCDP